MNQKTLFKLEYDKIIALLEKEATSFRGGQLCRRLKPMTDINKINTFQEQTETGYCMVAEKRIHIGDRLRYIPMGQFIINNTIDCYITTFTI